MKIERKCGGYYTVQVEADELVVRSGKTLPYPAWIGTVSRDGNKITIWQPAASKPRGYTQAAYELLEEAQRRIKEGTWQETS